MSNPAYKQFRQFKKEQRDALIKERSRITLEWYEAIGVMLEDPVYEYSYDFLISVTTFIETKEYITDKQIEAVKNIMSQTQDFNHNSREPF